jgi:hypothetical protein
MESARDFRRRSGAAIHSTSRRKTGATEEHHARLSFDHLANPAYRSDSVLTGHDLATAEKRTRPALLQIL